MKKKLLIGFMEPAICPGCTACSSSRSYTFDVETGDTIQQTYF
jgi:hypothetical protein